MALQFYIYNKQTYGDICQRQTNKCHSAKSRAAAEIVPNPNNGNFTLRCPDNEPFTYTVYDSRGSIIFNGKSIPASSIVLMELPYLTKGIYNFVITTNKIVVSLKFNIN